MVPKPRGFQGKIWRKEELGASQAAKLIPEGLGGKSSNSLILGYLGSAQAFRAIPRESSMSKFLDFGNIWEHSKPPKPSQKSGTPPFPNFGNIWDHP